MSVTPLDIRINFAPLGKAVARAIADANAAMWRIGHAAAIARMLARRPFVGWNPRLERVTNGW